MLRLPGLARLLIVYCVLSIVYILFCLISVLCIFYPFCVCILLQASRGMHGSTYTKALASLKSFTPDQMAEMQEAASYLAEAQGMHAALWACNELAKRAMLRLAKLLSLLFH